MVKQKLLKLNTIKKYVALAITQTDSLYGFSTILVDTDDENIATINRLVETFNKVKKIDNSINSISYFSCPINITIMNDDFEGGESKDDEPILIELSDDDFIKSSDVSDNDYRLESPIIRVSDMSIQIIYNSKYTSDEVYSTLPIGIIEKLLNTIQIGDSVEDGDNDCWDIELERLIKV